MNYDWSTGGTDHVTILVDPTSYLVNSHNNDRQNAPWTMGGAAGGYTFTRINTTYTA